MARIIIKDYYEIMQCIYNRTDCIIVRSQSFRHCERKQYRSTNMYQYILQAILLYISCVNCEVDLTVIPETGGANVVEASLEKITASRIFPKDDQQFYRRIAFITKDGLDPATYSGSNNNGGIWQLSEEKYILTKSTSQTILKKIKDIFNIDWSNTVWADLKKPFYSALAARLFFESGLTQDETYPFSTNIQQQTSIWVSAFAPSQKNPAQLYIASAIELNKAERKHK